MSGWFWWSWWSHELKQWKESGDRFLLRITKTRREPSRSQTYSCWICNYSFPVQESNPTSAFSKSNETLISGCALTMDFSCTNRKEKTTKVNILLFKTQHPKQEVNPRSDPLSIPHIPIHSSLIFWTGNYWCGFEYTFSSALKQRDFEVVMNGDIKTFSTNSHDRKERECVTGDWRQNQSTTTRLLSTLYNLCNKEKEMTWWWLVRIYRENGSRKESQNQKIFSLTKCDLFQLSGG